MDEILQRELLAFDEKIALGKLEVKKAEERVAELEYHKHHFLLGYFLESKRNEKKN